MIKLHRIRWNPSGKISYKTMFTDFPRSGQITLFLIELSQHRILIFSTHKYAICCKLYLEFNGQRILCYLTDNSYRMQLSEKYIFYSI